MALDRCTPFTQTLCLCEDKPGYGDSKYARWIDYSAVTITLDLETWSLVTAHTLCPKAWLHVWVFQLVGKIECAFFFTGFAFFMSIACREGWFGVNCSQQCSEHCRDNATCNHVTGQCDGGCNAGWTGTLCDQGIFFSFCFVLCKIFKMYIFILVLII